MTELTELLNESGFTHAIAVRCIWYESDDEQTVIIEYGQGGGMMRRLDTWTGERSQATCSRRLSEYIMARLAELGIWTLNDTAAASPPLDGVAYEVVIRNEVKRHAVRLENPGDHDDAEVRRIARLLHNLTTASRFRLRYFAWSL